MAKDSTKRTGKDADDDGADWQAVWDARKAALEKILGPAKDGVYTSMIPIYMGGQCDVLSFTKHVKGVTYVTAGLTVTSQQKPSKAIGQYELMMCTRRADDRIPGMLSGLSNYTLSSMLEANDTIDLGEEQPPGVTIRALVALEYDPPKGRFELMGAKCGLLLLVGITSAELTAFRSKRTDEVLAALKQSVLPYTELKRKSVI